MISVEQQLARIEAKVDRVLARAEPPTVGIEEAMQITGTKSHSALYRMLHGLGVSPFAHGKYRRKDITNAIARRALDIESETRTEGKVRKPRVNPHD